jgi:hypothetical protein
MSPRALLFAACLAFAAAPAHAAEPQSAPGCPAALAGEYQLDGVMETGSGLLLRGDCSFEWFFSYGALDLAGKGRWKLAPGGIVLEVEDMAFPPQMPETKFERMSLRGDEGALVPSWPWDMDAFRAGAERGRYERVEP